MTSRKTITVLLAGPPNDQYEALSGNLRAISADLHLDVTIQTNGAAALSVIDEYAPRLVVIDRSLRDVPAMTVLQRALARCKEVVAILTEDRVDRRLLATLPPLGVAGYVSHRDLEEPSLARALADQLRRSSTPAANGATSTAESPFSDRDHDWGNALRDALRMSADAAVLADGAGRIAWMNDSFGTLTGEANPIGADLELWLPDIDVGALRARGASATIEMFVRPESGRSHKLKWQYIPVAGMGRGWFLLIAARGRR